MRWLSVKKYIPPEGSWLICRFSHVDGWESYLTAKSVRIEDEKILGWEAFNSEFDEGACHITHFLIPDAVEIEE